MKTFTPYKLKNLTLKNRIVMAPMCMYSAGDDGVATDFHETHYTTRAVGGVGLIIVEATGVNPSARISDHDLGLWNDEQRDALTSIVKNVKSYGSAIGIQLAHAGRKHVGVETNPVAPSPIAFDDESRVPTELSIEAIEAIIDDFKQAAIRAVEAGFDTIEIHSAHGYLIHEFLSPISNKRTDKYGGSLENRVRLLKEISTSIKEVIPKDMPLLLRISATDYHEDGIECQDMVNIINLVKEYIDVVHVSSGGLVNVWLNVYPGYQVGFSETIKHECDIKTISVGKITDINMVEELLNNNRCDLVALGRELLRNPYFALNTCKDKHKELIPKQYERGFM